VDPTVDSAGDRRPPHQRINAQKIEHLSAWPKKRNSPNQHLVQLRRGRDGLDSALVDHPHPRLLALVVQQELPGRPSVDGGQPCELGDQLSQVILPALPEAGAVEEGVHPAR
jgi:hypothetical protein